MITKEISIAERDSAKEVYRIMTDLIRIHQKLMFNYWHAGMPLAPIAAAHAYIPDNYPLFADIYHQIRRNGFDLPAEIIRDTIRLAEDIYGPFNTDQEKWGDEIYPDMIHDQEDFDRYLGYHGCDEDMQDWFNFTNEQAEGYYDALDDIFQRYFN